ncbi:hypothetical protein KS4_09200 [Poriferisphaera corsica]|uniref:Uncharacterized protein n=1 Tax=Poriferisphaera corsica TaxID=2528020 RepID=A0A517YRP3_9BACT|nr:hypothetical protein KS4_09200 [Poriferisphaera corsica]
MGGWKDFYFFWGEGRMIMRLAEGLGIEGLDGADAG